MSENLVKIIVKHSNKLLHNRTNQYSRLDLATKQKILEQYHSQILDGWFLAQYSDWVVKMQTNSDSTDKDVLDRVVDMHLAKADSFDKENNKLETSKTALKKHFQALLNNQRTNIIGLLLATAKLNNGNTNDNKLTKWSDKQLWHAYLEQIFYTRFHPDTFTYWDGSEEGFCLFWCERPLKNESKGEIVKDKFGNPIIEHPTNESTFLKKFRLQNGLKVQPLNDFYHHLQYVQLKDNPVLQRRLNESVWQIVAKEQENFVKMKSMVGLARFWVYLPVRRIGQKKPMNLPLNIQKSGD